MTRIVALLLSTGTLTLSACAEEGPEAETADAAMNEGEAEPFDNMDDPPETDGETRAAAGEGLRYTEGDETPPDDLGQNPAVNLAQDLAAGPAGLAAGVAAGLSGEVDAYVRNAALGNLYEIQAGRIAVERGGSNEVREIGRLVVQDHQELQEELVASLAEADLDIALPTELEGRRQGLIDNLNAASDADFDAAFLHQQEAAHLEATALHEGFEAAGEPEALTDYAGMAGEVVRGHLGQVTQTLPAAVDGE